MLQSIQDWMPGSTSDNISGKNGSASKKILHPSLACDSITMLTDYIGY